jgi:hypothetical protein
MIVFPVPSLVINAKTSFPICVIARKVLIKKERKKKEKKESRFGG